MRTWNDWRRLAVRASLAPLVVVAAAMGGCGLLSEESDAADEIELGADDAMTLTTASQVPATTTVVSVASSEAIAAACDQGVPLAAGDIAPIGEPVLLADDEGFRLCLGPVRVLGAAIEQVETSPDTISGDWLVSLVFTVDGIEAFNLVAADCFARSEETCPTGRAAVIVDNVVLSAPSIQAPSFERDQIVVSGRFDEAEARSLAKRISGGGLTIRPVLFDLGP